VIDECFISFDRMLKKLPVLYLTLYIALLLGLFCPTDMMAQKGSKTDKANNLFHTGKWGLESAI
jgi:hypothetical protein